MKPKFKVTDIVYLLSSPDVPMTIAKVITKTKSQTGETYYKYSCTWHRGKTLDKSIFNEELLTLIKPEL